MANKKSKTRQGKASENRDAVRRTRVLQIVFFLFSVMLILSMILSLTNY
jgi:hypothetical protein